MKLFVLPDEGQKVVRIAEAFGTCYTKHNPEDQISEKDSTLLTCLILMLNTDAHNEKVL